MQSVYSAAPADWAIFSNLKQKEVHNVIIIRVISNQMVLKYIEIRRNRRCKFENLFAVSNIYSSRHETEWDWIKKNYLSLEMQKIFLVAG